MDCSHTTHGSPCRSRAVSGTPYCARHTAPSPFPRSQEPPLSSLGEGAGGEGHDAKQTQSHHAKQREIDAETRENGVIFDLAAGRTCEATTKAGKRCRMAPPRGQTLCMNHRSGAQPGESAEHARQARLARLRKRPSVDFLQAVIALNDRTSIQATLDEVIRLSLAGRLDPKRARVILQACAIAVRNFDPAPITLAGPKPQQHDWQSYFGRVKAALLTIDPLLRESLEAPSEDPQ